MMARSKRLRARPGRPPKDLAGDVEGQILDAAEKLFLEKGFESASIDQIAEMAPASKPTIYAHFSGKEALFSAVVARIINGLSDFEGYVPEGRTVQDKLTSLGSAIVARGIEDLAGVARVTIAEAQRFPDLSRHVHEASRNRAVDAVSLLLNDANSDATAAIKTGFQPKNTTSHSTKVFGSHSTPNAYAGLDRGQRANSTGRLAVLCARACRLFSVGL